MAWIPPSKACAKAPLKYLLARLTSAFLCSKRVREGRWPYLFNVLKPPAFHPSSCYRYTANPISVCLSLSVSSMSRAMKAAISFKKLATFGATMFGRSFNSSKCKTVARLATSRIKLLRNKREMQVKQMRRDVALLLQSGQDATARIRVEHVIREQNIMAANEIIELFCELVVVRLSVIAKQRGCPADLKEGISSLIFAAPRCSDIPELQQIRKIFEKKYGKDFVSAAAELRPDCGVNRTLIEKLSVRTPTGEVKLKLMKEIAKEYQIEWDTTESELELLKPPEELLDGPRTFVSATSMPVKPIPSQTVEPNEPNNRSCNVRESNNMHFKDIASAAQAAAESAEKAVAAAQAAAYLASPNTNTDDFSSPISSNKHVVGSLSSNSIQFSAPNAENFESRMVNNQSKLPGRTYGSQNFDRSHNMNSEGAVLTNLDSNKIYRRHSYNAPVVHSDIKFDDSDGFDSDTDEEMEMEKPPSGAIPEPPNRPPPPPPPSHVNQPKDDKAATDNLGSFKQNPVSRIHPKLPDYDALTARFEALKYHRS
ncbi:uncharacterized protein LOC131237091 isoform X2 [Magnolia sinica]|uniref:uncharacterized protein LOC131237091 isoform X2 n=1 Tax=Magnolia sinica TaxID=86752 RepID=UPI0026584494|nr:uncharacterized protein LOC131237091 isoform X2 [Magnolia sinica]